MKVGDRGVENVDVHPADIERAALGHVASHDRAVLLKQLCELALGGLEFKSGINIHSYPATLPEKISCSLGRTAVMIDVRVRQHEMIQL